MERIISTERLILRPLTVADAPDVFEWTGDPVVNKFMNYSIYENIDQVKKWISQIKDEDNSFGYILKSTGKVIGSGSIRFNDQDNVYELGYNLNRAFWNHGFATEAAKALVKWAYENCGARDFTAMHANENTASGNVIRKCGFVFDKYGQYSKFDNSRTFEASCYKLHLD